MKQNICCNVMCVSIVLTKTTAVWAVLLTLNCQSVRCANDDSFAPKGVQPIGSVLSTGRFLEMTDLIDTFDYTHSPADGCNDKINTRILL